jgi:hypothetical protein
MLTEEEKRTLLLTARRSLRCAIARRTSREEPEAAPPVSCEGRLAAPAGAFVTLRISGNLRGCIGYLESPLPLVRVVEEVAAKAAFEDPRFQPLSAIELEHVSVEISVLGPFHRIRDIADIHVGEHGIMIELGRSRGVLLPQVAVEHGWDRIAFLDHVSRKAGLPTDAWSDPTASIFVFNAEVFEEEKNE